MNYTIPEEYMKTLIKLTLTHNVLSIRIPEIKFSINDVIIDVKVHTIIWLGQYVSSKIHPHRYSQTISNKWPWYAEHAEYL